jgi:hypothetical protein
MQEEWNFKIDQSFVPNPDNFIKDLIQSKSKDLGIFLSYYFKKEGAIAEKVKLGSEILFLTDHSGTFKLEFDLVHFNACLAIHEQKRDQLDINFEVDLINETIKLIGPYYPERGMDEI